PIFHSNRDATELFHDFHRLSCQVTLDFYTNVFDEEPPPTAIQSVEALLARQVEDREAIEARNRFFLGQQVDTLRPLQSPDSVLVAPQSAAAARDELLKARDAMKTLAEAYQQTFAAYDSIDWCVLHSLDAESKLNAELGIDWDQYLRRYSTPE